MRVMKLCLFTLTLVVLAGCSFTSQYKILNKAIDELNAVNSITFIETFHAQMSSREGDSTLSLKSESSIDYLTGNMQVNQTFTQDGVDADVFLYYMNYDEDNHNFYYEMKGDQLIQYILDPNKGNDSVGVVDFSLNNLPEKMKEIDVAESDGYALDIYLDDFDEASRHVFDDSISWFTGVDEIMNIGDLPIHETLLFNKDSGRLERIEFDLLNLVNQVIEDSYQSSPIDITECGYTLEIQNYDSATIDNDLSTFIVDDAPDLPGDLYLQYPTATLGEAYNGTLNFENDIDEIFIPSYDGEKIQVTLTGDIDARVVNQMGVELPLESVSVTNVLTFTCELKSGDYYLEVTQNSENILIPADYTIQIIDVDNVV